MSDLEDWLRDHGLEIYLQVFESENITLPLLPVLKPDDLREMGLTIGHRRIFLEAVSTLQTTDESNTNDDIRLIDAERRQLTVMFVDLVGSTALAEQRDPEEMADLLRLYNHTVETQIEKHGGYIARYMGDGMLVYFGWPKAREDDAQQSVLAGLAIVSEVSNIVDVTGDTLKARVGVDSGLVVVGEIIGQGISQEKAVVGDAPNRAARLQSVAKPGQVIIGPQTKSRLGDSFEFESLQLQTLKGIKNQVEPWSVLRKRTDITRFQARSGNRIAPLAGRQEELDAFRYAIENKGFNSFFISGEAGVGKSRLIHEIDEIYGNSPVFKVHYQCSANHSSTYMYPVVEQLNHDLHIHKSDNPVTTIKNDWYLPCENSDDHISVLTTLLEVPTDDVTTETQSPQRQRSRTLEVIVENCCARSRLKPCLVIFEDLQWADSSTLELINTFLSAPDSSNIFLIGNYRSDFKQPDWMNNLEESPRCCFFHLNPLTADISVSLLKDLAGDIPLHKNTIKQIVEQSDGNPLYLEELSRSFLDNYQTNNNLPSANDELGPGSVPPTLHDALMEQLDSLESARYIAQVGALIGREFQANLIEKISSIDKHRLLRGLKELLDASIIRPKNEISTLDSATAIGSDVTYVFRHALIQQSAYDSQLLNNRKKLHLTLANHLFKEDDQTTETHMENIARHYTLAEQFDLAAQCWLRASQALYTKAAMTDALSCTKQGLQALHNLKGNQTESKEVALGLHFIRGHAAAQLFGGASKEAVSSFETAEGISESTGNTQQLFAVNFGLFYHHWSQLDEAKKAVSIAYKMRELADQINTPVASLVANSVIGAIDFHVGDVIEADDCLHKAYQTYSPSMHNELVRDYGFNMGLFSGAYYALSRMGRGYLQSAETQMNQCMEHANSLNHAPTTGYTMAISLSVRLMLNQPASSIIMHCDNCIELSMAQDLPFWATFAKIIKGAALSRDGQHVESTILLDEGIASWLESRSTVTIIWWYSLYSDAFLAKNDATRALHEAETAIAYSERTQEMQFLSECFLSKGNALSALGQHSLAENAYLEAISSSKKHRNLYAELRSAVALAELYQHQGQSSKAHNAVAPVYNAFPEYGDNCYLLKAQGILDQPLNT